MTASVVISVLLNHITNQEIDVFDLFIFKQSGSEPFVELCFEAGQWIA